MSGDPRDSLISIAESFDDFGMYAHVFRGDGVIEYRANEQFHTASCYKVIDAIGLYIKLNELGLSDSAKLPYTAKDRVTGSGILKWMDPNSISIHDLLELMLNISDNTATYILERYIGNKQQQAVIDKLGLKKTHIRCGIRELANSDMGLPADCTPERWDKVCIERGAKPVEDSALVDLDKGNVSTPYELCEVMKELVNPGLIPQGDAQKILKAMRHSDPDDIIVRFGKYIDIAQKGGWAVGLRSDMNIVFSGNPFYMTTMAKELSHDDRNRLEDHYPDIVNLAIECFNQ